MDHIYQEIETPWGHKKLIIKMCAPEHTLVGLFLLSENVTSNWYIETFQRVLSGKDESASFAGNICALDITADTTTISDIFAEDESQTCIVNTKELYDLILEWKSRNDDFIRAERSKLNNI